MITFEQSRERKGRRSSRNRGRFEDRPKRRDSRGSRMFEDRPKGRGRRDSGRRRGRLEMTKVICSACGDECEVPFKPKSDKPLFCSDCFEKNEKGSSSMGRSNKNSDNGPSERDIDIINEKLNKIMKALKIR